MSLLQEKANNYGITKLAVDLDLCEMSVRNKLSGKSKITNPEMLMIKNVLNLTDEEVNIIKEELN